MTDLHLLEDCGAIVGHCDVSVGGNEDFVETAGAQRALDEVRNRAGGKNVGFDGFATVLALLSSLAGSWSDTEHGGEEQERILLSDNDERTTLLILDYLGCLKHGQFVARRGGFVGNVPFETSRSVCQLAPILILISAPPQHHAGTHSWPSWRWTGCRISYNAGSEVDYRGDKTIFLKTG